MEISVHDYGKLLNQFNEILASDSSYATETIRGVSTDIRRLSKHIPTYSKGETEAISGCFKFMVVDFINEAAADSTKARRLYSCQLLSKYLFKEKIFDLDILSGIRIQDIITGNNDKNKRFNHKEDVLNDDEINSLLEQTWTNFTANFDPVNYLLLSLLLSGVKITDLAEMVWEQVILENGKVTLIIERNKMPLSQRIEMKRFIDCMVFYKRTDTDRIFPLSKAGLIQRVNMIGNKAGMRNISPRNFRWTCIYDMVAGGFVNESIAEIFGITKGYLDRISWE